MNRIYKLVLTVSLVFSVAAFQGCKEDRLEVQPVNEFLSNNFFQSEDQVLSGLIAAYDPLGWSMAYGQWISYVMYGEIRSDNAHAGGDPSNNDQPGWQEFDDYANTNTNTVLQPLYRRCYIGIFRANTVLEKSEIESAAVSRFKAEAKFLRAFYHFELFKNFGPIPVVTELIEPSNVDLERNRMSEVFGAIVADLNDAINLLPTTVTPSEAGRATKGAALGLLGKAYLYWADLGGDDSGKFDLAADAFKRLIDLGIYELEDDFQTLFDLNVRNTGESVFEIQHNNLWSSDWVWFEGIDGNGVIQLCGVRGLCDAHPDYQAGWGFMLPTASLWNHYLSDDGYRKDVAMMDQNEIAAELMEAGVSCSPDVDLSQGNPIDFTGYWQEKYANWKSYEGNNVNGGDPNLTKAQNTHYIRYADVLLMYAEALHRGSGSDGDAMDQMDIVRERAAGPGDNTGSFRTTQELMNDEGMSLLEAIWYERRAELAMEGDRWYDLVRSGRASADLFENGDLRKDNFDANEHLWLPVALEETSVAPMLTTYPDASLFN